MKINPNLIDLDNLDDLDNDDFLEEEPQELPKFKDVPKKQTKRHFRKKNNGSPVETKKKIEED